MTQRHTLAMLLVLALSTACPPRPDEPLPAVNVRVDHFSLYDHQEGHTHAEAAAEAARLPWFQGRRGVRVPGLL